MFADREDAGRRLAAALGTLADQQVVVVGLARGGVPVASVVARTLGAPLDVVVVRKLGVPSRPELAMGAIGEEGVLAVNDVVVRASGVTPAQVEGVEARERDGVEQRAQELHDDGRLPVPLEGRTVLVVDDGLATGATALAACEVVRRRGAARVVVAVPVGAPEAVHRLEATGAGVVCLEDLPVSGAVSQAYREFEPVDEARVVELLQAASPALPEQVRRALPPSRQEPVER